VRLVLDTNALVQAALSPHGPAAVIVGLVMARSLRLLVDDRILDEYDDVLSRAVFGLDPSDVRTLIERISRVAEPVVAHGLPGGSKGFPDRDDLPFLEVAVSGKADVLVSSNLKDFPPRFRCGMTVITPVDFVQTFIRIG
jgi:putative PIN family toxin of toxin-antitoxin system